jgi:predicted O-methyltransferase YrrM
LEQLDQMASPVPSRAIGAALRMLAAVVDAEHALVLGSTGGVSEAWLREGMRHTGTLTVVDPDPTIQSITRDCLIDSAEHLQAAVRVITARAPEVLARLTDGGYDLVLVAGDTAGLLDLDEVRRLLRPGGLFVIRLDDAELAGPLREMTAVLRDDERWTTAWLTVGDGLITAVYAGPGPSESTGE